MNTLILLALLGSPPSFAEVGVFGDPTPTAAAPAEPVAPEPSALESKIDALADKFDGMDKLRKDHERLVEAVNHVGDRLSSVERVAKYAARKVAQTIDASPTGEETGLDGWDGPTQATARPATAPAGQVWCVECGAYVPASHVSGYLPARQPAYGYGASYAAYRPATVARPVQFARGGG